MRRLDQRKSISVRCGNETLLVVSATGLKLEWWLVGIRQDFYTQKCGRYARLHKRSLRNQNMKTNKKRNNNKKKTKSSKQPTAKRNQRVYVLPPPSFSASFSSVLCAHALATHPKYGSTWAIRSLNHDRFSIAIRKVVVAVAATATVAPRMQSCAREPATQPVAHRTHPPHRCMGMCTQMQVEKN